MELISKNVFVGFVDFDLQECFCRIFWGENLENRSGFLYVVSLKVASVLQVLWPFLLECVVPEPFTKAMGPLCRSLGHLAAKKREEEGADFNIDFDVQSK